MKFTLFSFLFLIVFIGSKAYGRLGFWQLQKNKILIGTTAQTLPQYGCSSYVEILSRTPSGAVLNQVSNLTVDIAPVANVKFYSDPSCTTEVTSVVIPTGVSSALVYFSADLVGTFSFQASATNYSSISQTQTITANNFIWTGNGGDSLWSNASNWSNNAVPGASNIAIFNNTCVNCDVIIGANINVAGIKIEGSYTGSIIQNSGVTITVGTRHFTMKAGTFTGANGNIAIDSSFYLMGGSFTSTSGILSSRARHATYSVYFSASSVFNHNSGTLRLQHTLSSSSSHTLSYYSDQEFNNVELLGGARINNTGSMTVNGYFKIDMSAYASNIFNGTFNLKGDIEIVNYEDYLLGSDNSTIATWVINGTGNQTITTNTAEYHMGTRTPKLTVNKASGSLTVTGSLSSRELKVLSGTLSMSSGMYLVLRGAGSSPQPHLLNGGTYPNISFYGSKGQSLGDTATCDNLKINVSSNFARVQGGTIYVKDNVDVVNDENYSGQSSLRIELIGSNPSSVTVASSPAGLKLPGTLVVNKSTQATAVNLLSNVLINGNSSDLIVQSGTINMSGFNLTMGSASGTDNQLTLESGTTINRGGGTLSYEAITNNGGTINP